MNITQPSATDLTQKTSSILNTVYYKKTPVTIYKHGKPMVKIVPLENIDTTHQDTQKKLDSYYGSIQDFPETKSARKFSKKDLSFSQNT